MKQGILIYLALCLGSVSTILGQGQDNIVLNSPLKVTRDSAIVACKEITLNPSFEFTALAGKGLELNIDPTCATPEYGCITITAKDASGNLLKGGVYKVTNSNDQQVGGNYTATTGSVNAINLKYSTYKVVQVTAPAGYELTTASTISIAVTNDNCRDVEFKYKKQEKPILKGCITISAKDQTGSVVNGGVYKVLDADKQQVGSYYTVNVNGSLEICEIVYGNYTIVEVTTPVKYRLLSGSLSSVTVDGSNVPNVFEYQLIEDKPYEKGKVDSIYIKIANGHGLVPYDFDNLTTSPKMYDFFKGRYNTVDVGEYTYTSENLKGIYRNYWSESLEWLNWDDSILKNMNESYEPLKDEKPLSVSDFYAFYGAWFKPGGSTSSYRRYTTFLGIQNVNGSIEYTEELSGWELPSVDDMGQLMGQAPRKTGDILSDIMDFVAAGKKDTPQGHVTDWSEYSNTSGLSLTPLGLRTSSSQDLSRNIEGYKTATRIAILDPSSDIGTREFSSCGMIFSKDCIVYDNREFNTQVRYCRAKTAEELGYKICIDQCHDAVVILPLNENTDLPEIPKGLERGIILRYANIANRTVSKSWLEIRQEAVEYRKVLTSLPDAPELKFPNNCDKGSIKISALEEHGRVVDHGIYKITDQNGKEWNVDHFFEIYNFTPGKYTVSLEGGITDYELISDSKFDFEVVANQTNLLSFKYKRILQDKLDLNFEVVYRRVLKNVGDIELNVYDTVIVNYPYEGVRIGEHYWMNRNMSHPIRYKEWTDKGSAQYEGTVSLEDVTVTREMIVRLLKASHLQTSYYDIKDDTDFLKYYGRYYQKEAYTLMTKMRMSEKVNNGWLIPEDKKDPNRWKAPDLVDFRQLTAAAPLTQACSGLFKLVVSQVNNTLGVNENENPFAINMKGITAATNQNWFSGGGNIYGFNLMPSGQAAHIDNLTWSNGLRAEDGTYDHNAVVTGGLIQLLQTVYYPAGEYNTFRYAEVISSYGSDVSGDSYYRMPVRFMRRLTDIELGYKLYIQTNNTTIRNSQAWKDLITKGNVEGHDISLLKDLRTNTISIKDFDIIKTDLNTPVPANSVELPKGYIRGLYVQYILDNPNPKTVQEILLSAYNTDDNALCRDEALLDKDGNKQYNDEGKLITLGVDIMCPCIINELPDSSDMLDSPTTRQAEVKESRISVYPNPTENVLYIDSTDEVQSVKIYSVSGSVVISLDKLNGNSIDVSSLASGMYVVRIQTEDGNYTQKVFKK